MVVVQFATQSKDRAKGCRIASAQSYSIATAGAWMNTLFDTTIGVILTAITFSGYI